MPGAAEFEPIIKWSGSKRLVADEIVSHFPDEYNTYYEPFVGGGSVMFAAHPSQGVAGDKCEPLIELWQLIRDSPDEAVEYYRSAWQRLQEEGEDAYYEIRREFNNDRDPRKLLFLTRTCVNGLIRFNSDGEFNASLHLSRSGIQPNKLARTASKWSRRLSNVSFTATDYTETLERATAGDMVFLDPPYFNTETLYYGSFDTQRFLDQLKSLCDADIPYALTLDGSAGEHEYEIELPEWAYSERYELHTGTSPYRKVVSGESSEVVQTLFLNYESRSRQTTLDGF